MSEPAEPAFEAILARLQEVVGELERGDLPLERSLALFEEGVRLARQGGSRLDAAEARVEELLAVTEEGVRTRPLDPKSSADAPRTAGATPQQTAPQQTAPQQSASQQREPR